jgi:hypothetical protein
MNPVDRHNGRRVTPPCRPGGVTLLVTHRFSTVPSADGHTHRPLDPGTGDAVTNGFSWGWAGIPPTAQRRQQVHCDR